MAWKTGICGVRSVNGKRRVPGLSTEQHNNSHQTFFKHVIYLEFGIPEYLAG